MLYVFALCAGFAIGKINAEHWADLRELASAWYAEAVNAWKAWRARRAAK